ncbi:MAG: type IV pilin [Candidatus Bathyarchaeia archaeon]|jgi:hypothetical protein
MKNLLRNRKALSTVVTTLIILVVSVLLAGVVTYFAINVVSTRVQNESLNLTYQHVWYNTTEGAAEAAIMVTNTGGRDVVLQNIAVRGQSMNSSYVFYFPVTVQGDLPYVSQTTNISTSVTAPTGFGYSGKFLHTNTIVLASGSSVAVYMAQTPTGIAPGSVTVNDVGLTIDISIFSAQATYIKETNVNAA